MTGDAHWQNVYATKGDKDVSWYQDSPSPSLELITETGVERSAPIIDIGGGASVLVDALLRASFSDITVLDLSQAALDIARQRIGVAAEAVTWIAGDVTEWSPARQYAVWHDRAAFHFLIEAEARAKYIERLRKGLMPGGHAIIGTFAEDGPEKCSGLPVARYSSSGLANTLGDGLTLVRKQLHVHRTPWGAEQRFQFSVLRRDA